MFTGIIEHLGMVRSAQPMAGGSRLVIDAGGLAEGISLGASVAVNGVCLTVAAISGSVLSFDVITETLRRTSLGILRPGQKTNLERSLRVGDRIDGHFVQGHVDGTGIVRRIIADPKEFVLWIEPSAGLVDYITPKGSIAVDGVSLTVAEYTRPDFSVALIPTTLERTTLSLRRVGDTVNLESDMLVRATVNYLRQMGSNLLAAHANATQEGWS